MTPLNDLLFSIIQLSLCVCVCVHSQTGLTALHVAACFGQVDFVREMLTKVPAIIRSDHPHSTLRRSGEGPPRQPPPSEVGPNDGHLTHT